MIPTYMREREAFLLVYTITCKESFDAIMKLYQEIIRIQGTNNIPIVVCGNKCDLADKREVSSFEGQELAFKIKAKFFETSALSNINCDSAFDSLLKRKLRPKENPDNNHNNHEKKDCFVL